MKTIKRISVLTHVLITALIIKDEFYLTNALLLPGLKILMSLSLFLRYIIIAASDVLIEVSSWLWRPGTGSMVFNVLVVCMRSLVDPFKRGSEYLLPCEGTSCGDPLISAATIVWVHHRSCWEWARSELGMSWVIAPCSFNPKSLLLDVEVLHWMKSLHAKGRHFHWGRYRDNNSGLQIWREYNLWCRQEVGWPTAAVLYPALVHLEDCMTRQKLWWWPWETFMF